MMQQALYNLNVLDRILAYFAATSARASIGETFYQGEDIPHFFFVNANASPANDSDDNDGSDPRRPMSTLAEALDRCTASRGDVIFLLPRHSETLTADLSLDVAGVSVFGIGNGSMRPTFTVGDAVGESVLITAANFHLENCIFICGTDAQTSIMNIKAVDVTVKDCEFREVVTTKQPLCCIDVGGGGAANTCDRCRILGCKFFVPTAGDGDHAIGLEEVNDSVEIGHCIAIGDWDNACIHNVTGKVLTNLYIHDCILENKLTGQHSIELVSACTGMLVRNMYKNDMTQQTGVDPGSCFSFECYQCDVIDASGILTPIIT